MTLEIRCPIHECVWVYHPNEKSLDYAELSSQAHKELNELDVGDEFIAGYVRVIITETYRRTERILRQHLESHDVTEWLMTLDYYKNLST